MWVAIWAALVFAMLLLRPAIPVDETRYLAVAWEMWWRHSIAVPYLNGEYYDGKPPLFFWLMHAGWLLFGVNEWWPRLIAPLAGLASLALVRAIARRLWPDHPAAELAPLILLGSFYFAVFCASTMFDALLVLCAVASMYFLVRAAQTRHARDFAATGVALGLGILAKGPVVFLPVAWVAACAPWWMVERAHDLSWRRWYGGMAGAVVVAGAVTALWLVPMALSSDRAYFENMVLHQTTGYVSESFSHQRPIWWYLPLLPLLLFPWLVWPRVWQSVARKDLLRDVGVRLCIVWAVGVLVTFSLISGKQAHYPLIAFPAVALLLARALPERAAETDRSVLLAAGAALALGLAIMVFGAGWLKRPAALWLQAMSPVVAYTAGAAFVAIAAAIAVVCRAALTTQVAALSASTCAAVLVCGGVLGLGSSGAYDVRAASAFLAQVASHGPIAVAANYDAQFNFYGRMQTRFQEIAPATALDWARGNSEGFVIAFYEPRDWSFARTPAPAFESFYRGGGVAIWRAADLIANPRIAQSFR